MWNGWMEKEFDRLRWLVDRLGPGKQPMEIKRVISDLQYSLDRLQTGYLELEDRLESLSLDSERLETDRRLIRLSRE